ncbi:MAG: hypothetical protein EOP11_15955 [Proteobacteria bacterium]|nr:MAG: hypothetical protein EOP11_15955 [Pseudomonadota bacterium]
MKNLILAFAFFASASQAFAAGELGCNVAVPKDPINRSQQFDQEIYSYDFASEEILHFVLVNKDASSVSRLSQADFAKRRADKNFADIDGQTMIIYQRGTENMVSITVRTVDASSEKGTVGGSISMGDVSQHLVAVIPADKGFAVACSTRH